MDFSVSLGIFNGPLDLLLFLVRKHELDIMDIPISMITGQFLEYLQVLEVLDCNEVGEFIAMASWLIEIKSLEVLPGTQEVEEELEDPRQDLVKQLLSYKKYRDRAWLLDERGRRWQQNYPRQANDLPVRRRDLAEEPIMEVELWDLVSAFGRIIRESQVSPQGPGVIPYDDTPIHTYMERIQHRLSVDGSTPFTSLFEPGMHKSSMVGIFLASLELVRHFRVRVEQNHLFGEIWLKPGDGWSEKLDFISVDEYDSPTLSV